jgi:hypothetical protein
MVVHMLLQLQTAKVQNFTSMHIMGIYMHIYPDWKYTSMLQCKLYTFQGQNLYTIREYGGFHNSLTSRALVECKGESLHNQCLKGMYVYNRRKFWWEIYYILTWSYCCISAKQVKSSPSETKVLNDVKNLFWFLSVAQFMLHNTTRSWRKTRNRIFKR